MATTVTVTHLTEIPATVAVWNLANGENGDSFSWSNFADRSIQFSGTFGTGGSVTLQGSNDGTNWQPLTDPQGNAITKTAAAIEQVLESTRFIRPVVTAGDGTTAIVCTLFARRA